MVLVQYFPLINQEIVECRKTIKDLQGNSITHRAFLKDKIQSIYYNAISAISSKLIYNDKNSLKHPFL